MEAFQSETVAQMAHTIMEAIQSGKMGGLFERYRNAVDDDLQTDYIQKCYQFWGADRGKNSKQQDYTPRSICDLVTNLTTDDSTHTVYDCCAGSGALTIAIHNQYPEIQFICEELDENVTPFLMFNLAIRRINAVVIRGDVLKNEIYQCWQIRPNGEYSDITPIESFTLGTYDICISNPPYNIPWEPIIPDGLFMGQDTRFPIVPPSNNANYAFVFHCLAHLRDDGRACFILPVGSTASKGKESDIRKYFVNENMLDYVIHIPDNMFESTSIPTILLGLRKNVDLPFFIDARKTYQKEIREQRGEDHNKHRTYKKKINVFTPNDIHYIVNAIRERRDIPRFSKNVHKQSIKKNEYILSPARYIDIPAEEHPHRPYKDIIEDLNSIAKDRGMVKLTMNETLARAMGWDEIAKLAANGEKLVDEINESLRCVGDLPPLKTFPYISLSKKAGEIKLENMDKNAVSSIFSIFMPMFKQHLYYLNDKENELLAELRDALLPDLMSGKIKL